MVRALSLSLTLAILALVGALSTYTLHVKAQELSQAERAQLEAEYDQLQEEIAEWEKVLADTRAKKNTLQGDVSYLNAQIKQAEAQIRQKNLAINNLAGEIRLKNARISELSSRIDKGHDSLAALLRKQDQVDDLSFFEIVLGADTAFALFEDVDNMTSIQIGLHENFTDIRSAWNETEEEKKALAAKQDQELDARYEVESKKQQVAQSEAEKQRLLSLAKTEEAAYQQVLAQRQAEAAAIRARLFPLRDTDNIQFGDAVRYAQSASAKTGVRPAMILAILSQESDLGRNVGNCLVTDLSTGDGKGKNTGTPFSGVMKSPRDTVPFERITKALGKDWSTTPVSCPQPGGYGGAMGPTQFIPSTWEMFESRIKTALGVAATNPWNAEHAIMATALYLSDVGAGLQTYTAERNAACIYYSGRSCSAVSTVYGDSVVAKAAKFQQDIDFLADN